jgi:hypothetical protein
MLRTKWRIRAASFAIALGSLILVVGPATSATAPAAKVGRARPPAVPFIEDDYDRALAEARARKVPLFVESWAPW